MRRVVIDLQYYLFSDAIALALKNADSDFEVHRAETPDDTIDLCRLARPYALLMGVSSYMPWRLEERMKIRDEVLRSNPTCKIVLMVDEKAEKNVADAVRQAKKDGLIDQFIYGSISAAYLTALMDTL